MSTEIEKPSSAEGDAKPPAMLDSYKIPRVDLDNFKRQLPDVDPTETQEWIEALDDVTRDVGPERADFILRKILKRARQLQIGLPGLIQSRYINTLSPEQEPEFPGDEQMELRIRRIVRW